MSEYQNRELQADSIDTLQTWPMLYNDKAFIQDKARECYRRQSLIFSYKTKQGNVIQDKVWDCYTRQSLVMLKKTYFGIVIQDKVWDCHTRHSKGMLQYRRQSLGLSYKTNCGIVIQDKVKFFTQEKCNIYTKESLRIF